MLEALRNRNLQKVLIVGNGAREHALGWRIKQDNPAYELEFAPGNAGTEEIGANLDIGSSDIDRLVDHCVDGKVSLVVVGPEKPLGMGIIDALKEGGVVRFWGLDQLRKQPSLRQARHGQHNLWIVIIFLIPGLQLRQILKLHLES